VIQHKKKTQISWSRNRTIDFTKDESEWQQVVFIEKKYKQVSPFEQIAAVL